VPLTIARCLFCFLTGQARIKAISSESTFMSRYRYTTRNSLTQQCAPPNVRKCFLVVAPTILI
jgi:hypothetical protein